MPEKQIIEKCSAVIQWVSSVNGASPRRGYIPTSIRMGNNVEMPFVGLGTGGMPSSEPEIDFAVRTALDLGYTHIDVTAGFHATIGAILKEYFELGKLSRKDIFITAKLPCTSHGRSSVEKSLRSQLETLQLDYVDLFLINTPCGVQIYRLKLARAIGISNFNVDQIQRVYSTAEVKPHNLQVEVHLHWPQKELVVLCQSLNVCLTAYAPIGSPGQLPKFGVEKASPLAEPLVLMLADKYKKSPAQILLRHLTQRNIVVIPKSTNAQRLKENLDSLKFTISDIDMEALGNIKPKRRVYTYIHRRNHPEYPFCELDDEEYPITV
uniref:Aldo_ket_red domain-containing protein n=1 Tax=Caenorhabditis tropicalis TaxID=1561998 RepID=A0A1I7T5R9_9PELO